MMKPYLHFILLTALSRGADHSVAYGFGNPIRLYVSAKCFAKCSHKSGTLN